VGPDGMESLRWSTIEPWNIRRDPDALSRNPQSGLYCIHQEYVDYHKLLAGEKHGYYQNVRDVLAEREDDSLYGRHDAKKKRGLVEDINKFRKQIFVREFWGDVLDHNGELVLSGVRLTIANRTVISRPIKTNFPTLRWPIHQFSALPHMRNFHGYSLIEGMLKMWKFRNNILCLVADKLSFILNGGYEVDENKMVNPHDKELYPGCTKAKKASAGAGKIFNLIETDKDFLPIVESLMGLTGNLYQNGTFVTELLKGELGDRKNITKGEVQIKTEQAMGVFEGIGHDVEYGFEQAISMEQEVLTTYWDPSDSPSYMQILGEKHASIIGQLFMLSPEQRVKYMRQETDIKVRGISLLFQKSALVDRLVNMAKLTDADRFRQYAKDYELLKKIADAMDASDVILSQEEMEQKQAEQTQMLAMQQVQTPGGMPGAEGAPSQDLVNQALAAAGLPAEEGAPV